MKVVRATHTEMDVTRHDQLFISREIAEAHVATWGVTDWGRVFYGWTEVTEERP